ncbi:hypothetical protein ACSSZE_13540 [Acidithiobacillus caldus]
MRELPNVKESHLVLWVLALFFLSFGGMALMAAVSPLNTAPSNDDSIPRLSPPAAPKALPEPILRIAPVREIPRIGVQRIPAMRVQSERVWTLRVFGITAFRYESEVKVPR